MKTQDNISLPKITNLIVIDSNENGFKALSDKAFKTQLQLGSNNTRKTKQRDG